MAVLLVITEHSGGLTPGRLEGYEAIRLRLSSLVDAPVESIPYEEVEALDADAVVLSGSYDPWAAHDPARLGRFGARLLEYQGPVLGICGGMQLQALAAGGRVDTAARPAQGFATVDVVDGDDLLAGLGSSFEAFAHHGDEVVAAPPGFRVLARSDACAIEAFAAVDRPWWGTQFHPERWDAARPAGRAVLARFFELAGIRPRTAAGRS